MHPWRVPSWSNFFSHRGLSSVEEDHATLWADRKGVNTLYGSFQLQSAQRGNSSQHCTCWILISVSLQMSRKTKNADASRHRGSLNGLMGIEMMWIICYGPHSHQISTKRKPYGRFSVWLRSRQQMRQYFLEAHIWIIHDKVHWRSFGSLGWHYILLNRHSDGCVLLCCFRYRWWMKYNPESSVWVTDLMSLQACQMPNHC